MTAVHRGLNDWSTQNPHITFVRAAGGDPDIVIRWSGNLYYGHRLGVAACTSCLGGNAWMGIVPVASICGDRPAFV